VKRTACALLLALCGCAPAWSASQYHAKIAATAEEALSAIQTVRLALAEAEQHAPLFSRPVEVSISNQEDALSSVSETFASVQPPDRSLDDERQSFLDLLDKAQTELAQARIDYRRGDVPRARAHIESLDAVVKQLEQITAP
jgi:hypothetical protein